MLKKNRMRPKGFTIVELLIVIVVIGILAAIALVSYNGIQTRAENTKTTSAIAAYAKAMMAHSTVNGTYPGLNGYRCVKDASDSNTCAQVSTGAATCFGTGQALRESAFDTLILSTVSSLPQVSSKSMLCGGQPYRGAYVSVNASGFNATFYVFYRGNLVTCPAISGLNSYARNQQDDVTLCSYTFPVLS